MYILVDKFRILLGIFTTKEKLDIAVDVIRKENPDCGKMYYQEIIPDTFDKTLINFWTMHPEKLIEIEF